MAQAGIGKPAQAPEGRPFNIRGGRRSFHFDGGPKLAGGVPRAIR
jgi:hypothetical protein